MIRVLLVSRETLFSRLLKQLLDREDDILVLPTVSDLSEVATAATVSDIVLICTGFEQHEALEIIAELQSSAPSARAIMLRVPEFPEQILPYLEAGARGYLRASDEVDQLLVVIRTVAQQGAYVDAAVAPLIVERLSVMSRALSEPVGDLDLDAELTAREMEILALIHAGETNQQISESLSIGVGTVKNHVHNILQKLRARDREDASRWYAWKHGISTGGDDERPASADIEGALSQADTTQAVIRLHGWTARDRFALREMLDLCCSRLGWPIGHLLVLNADGELAASGIWSSAVGATFPQFRVATEERRYSSETGVVSRQLQSPRPLWITDVRRDHGFGRRQAAEADGIRSGLFLPILHDDRLVGVMEFYSTRQVHPDPATVANIISDSTEMAELVATDDAPAPEELTPRS